MTKKTNYHHGDLRNALLSAAEEELIEKGVEAFSLRGVARRAGVSHGAPAHHFNDTEGLLTALATIGYKRLVETQMNRKHDAPKDPKSRLTASSLGYIDFAVENPALFRLMFSSDRPDKTSTLLSEAADSAFNKLAIDVAHVAKADPLHDQSAMIDVAATWALAHGFAALLISDHFDQIPFLAYMTPEERDVVFSEVILRASTIRPA